MSSGSSRKSKDKNPPKTLSKKAVYLPLVAFDHKVDGKFDPDAYLASRQSLPTSVQEKTLVEFWHKVGVEYHRTSTFRDSRNNGNKPVSLSDMEERIRSRAMTLIGGGIHTGWDTTTTTTTNNAKKSTNNVSSPKLKLARKRQRESKQVMHFSTKDEHGEMNLFLTELNGMWNDYMIELLQLPVGEGARLADYQQLTKDTQQWSRATACITNETAQLVGARVKIKACRHSPTWVGRIGYVVGKTKNTWNIIVEGPLPNKKTKRSKMDTSSRASEETTNGWRSLVVPKKGSELTLLISVDRKEKLPTKECKSDGSSSHEGLKSLPILAIDIQEAEE